MAKQKMKTKKALAKRFKKTATGKIIRASAGRGHLLSCKTRKRKRQLRRGALVSKTVTKQLSILLPG